MFIPVFTPNFLASYEAVVMTVLPPEPMTPMGLPLRRGFVCCSTEAKKASISAQRIIFDMSNLLYLLRREETVFSLILVPTKSDLRGFCLLILEIFLLDYRQKNPLKYYLFPPY